MEIGPGNFPHIPIKGSYFVDTSKEALKKLVAKGGKGHMPSDGTLPFRDNYFDLICASHVLEHIKDDSKTISEVFRTLKPGGTFILEVPIHTDRWSKFDEVAGHVRRYDVDELYDKLTETGFKLHKFNAYSSPINKYTSWFVAKLFYLFPQICVNIYLRLVPKIQNYISGQKGKVLYTENFNIIMDKGDDATLILTK